MLLVWAPVNAALNISTIPGVTAGYHRLWAHRSYNATKSLEYVLALLAAAAVQGPIVWWVRGHRVHHRYTDTDLDPYNARRGFIWPHIGWLIVKPRRPHGKVDVNDLKKNTVVMWQLRHYPWLVLVMAVAFPTLVAGAGWGDWKGGCVYAGFLKIVILHHLSSLLHQTHIIDCSRPRPVSIPWHIGSASLRSMTNILHETICSLPFLPSGKGIIIFIISSQWTIAMLLSGISMTPLNG